MYSLFLLVPRTAGTDKYITPVDTYADFVQEQHKLAVERVANEMKSAAEALGKKASEVKMIQRLLKT